MISIIICSVNKEYAQQVRQNIADTIGIEWEAIIIDNTVNPRSITQVYNEGAAKARYNVLCFAHEDILFKTRDWGKKVVESFESDAQLGLIGVAGSKYKSKVPAGWFTGVKAFDCGNIQHLNRQGITETIYFNPDAGKLLQQVMVMDGVFLCSPKNVWQNIQFEEDLLRGFHLYDIDYSIRVSAKYKAVVNYEINILHITKGNHFENNWLDYTLKWHEKMSRLLPASSSDIKADSKLESRIVKTWLIRLKHEKLTIRNKLRWLWATKIWTHPSAWPNVPLFIINSMIPWKKVSAIGK